MHWAAHGNTAAEIIYQRANSSKPNMGLTNFKGNQPTKAETNVAKNYLNEKELDILNRIVTAYIEMAELQALNQKPMYMTDWISKLDDFLKMTGNSILEDAGKISHKMATEKANKEYFLYKNKTKDALTKVEKDFVEYIDSTAKKLKKM